MLKVEDLEEISSQEYPYYYCKESGRMFAIRETKMPLWDDSRDRIRVSKVRLGRLGYKQVTHLIWFLCHGIWPSKGLVIDHIDRDPTNNRLSNLRLATQSQNMINRTHLRWGDKNLPQGVTEKHNRFVARLTIGGKYFISSFDTLEEAVAQRQEWERQHHKQFSPNAKPFRRI
jgi:hypothetical protein